MKEAKGNSTLHTKIQILPDHVANQIAAGEVLQRPANAVKELMENAIDAGASLIEVVVKEGGLSFLQVHDDGCGMSEIDARTCFERHATSKIRQSEDLFDIHTKGFRGEALASIAAVARVTLVTKRPEDQVGTCLQVEDSKILSQEPTSAESGTSFTIKNLFYNVPARKKFLKTARHEMKHIQEEFIRIALAHPNVGFTLHEDRKLIMRLDPANLKKRLMNIFGTNLPEKLVPVEEETDIVKIEGFLVKPEFAKKSRGEQYFFVNNRFIKNQYMHHAVSKACEELLPPQTYPGYFIFFSVDPQRLDVNIHPTKTEVKFEDESMIYAVLRSAVRRALGVFHLGTSLDFEQEAAFIFPHMQQGASLPQTSSPAQNSKSLPNYPPLTPNKTQNQNQPWESFYTPESNQNQMVLPGLEKGSGQVKTLQYKNKYLIAVIHGQLALIDQHRAHERVLYERINNLLESGKTGSQTQLFGETIDFHPSDMHLVEEMLPLLTLMGFQLDLIGQNSVVVRGIPVEAGTFPPGKLLANILEEYKHAPSEVARQRSEYLARILASKLAIRHGIILNPAESSELINDLLACKMPYISAHGKPVVTFITDEHIAQQMDKKIVN
jgi:DNA mismatch repair protein MutL